MDKKFKKLSPEFTDSVNGMNSMEIDSRILLITKEQQEVVEAKRNDQKLKEAKDLAKELSAPYLDCLKECKIKIEYLIVRLNEMGKV